ncbi:uncharacterized protein V6R79_009451 [Siganus canaliculatus]
MKHNKIITVFCALLHIQLLSGSSLRDQVHQTPPDMFTQQGQTAQIQCSHRIQDYNVILWYKQTDGQMKLLGYMYIDNPTLEPEVNVKIEGNANKDQNCTLTVEKLTVSSSAVYYCAASNTVLHITAAQHKNLHNTHINAAQVHDTWKPSCQQENMDVISWKHTLLTLSVFVLGMAGLVDGSDVNQPELLWKEKGKEATISCNHTKGFDYSQMYWYRQLPGETMKLIVFTRFGIEDHDFGEFSKDKFSATKPDAQSGTFTVKNLLPEDNGVYFCAVSQHSDEDELQGCSKTSAQQETRESRQDENRALKLLGYLNTQFANPEEDVKVKISFDGDGSKESSLSVFGLELKDSGVYFCAASRHSAAGSRGVETKTLCCSSH